MYQDKINSIQACLDHPLTEIETHPTISQSDFRKKFVKKNKPIVLTEMMTDWGATKKWSLDYFKQIGKDKQSYVAKANNFLEDNAKWEFNSFVESIERIENSDSMEDGGYLMNLSVLHMFPELVDDEKIQYIHPAIKGRIYYRKFQTKNMMKFHLLNGLIEM